ncbi:MAG TPA: FAD-dependent monooxygenase [Jatrophihabitantaceae bacterium]|nr:FAD-dependent monooxygenase [Jatrophihabitantaceae bacterium]
MRAVVVGAGPIGLYSGVALARAGYEVTIVDRDLGPAPDGTWDRKGVMQFMHPHFFRSIVHDVFAESAPDLWDAVVGAGGIPASPPGAPPFIVNLQSRRWVFERALRSAAADEPGVTLRAGHADRLEQNNGRVSGVVVDGRLVEADVVIDASGRSGKLGDDLRAPGEGGSCGFSYVARMYRARPGVDGMGAVGVPRGQLYDGYLAILFPQDDDTLSTLIVRRENDRELAELRHTEAFEAAMRVIPQFAEWTDPERFEPITEVMPGGGLTNTYRGQLGVDGTPALPGVYWVGDSMSTTNPAAGRGVSLGLKQAQALVRMITEDGADPVATSLRFQASCDENIRPWFEDHVYWDATLLRRFAGEDIDVDAKIPSDVICAAADVDPSIMAGAAPYFGMMAPPAVLAPYEERAREILRTGWRPALADGPSRDELVAAISERAAV